MLGGDENGTLGQVLAPAHLVAQSAEDRQLGQARMRPEASEIIDAAARPQQEWKADDHAECCSRISEGVESLEKRRVAHNRICPVSVRCLVSLLIFNNI